MIVYPAIDIRAGRCVRLVEGDFARETVFDADPATTARCWADLGATWIHVVDLDGARSGSPVNRDAIAAIVSAVPSNVQLGGGLRTAKDLEWAFGVGIERAILGTAVVADEPFLRKSIKRWPGRIAAGLDSRDGKLATQGWLEQTERSAVDVAVELHAAGVEPLIFTDIARDGTLRGPNLASLRDLVARVGSGVIASGGIGTLDDVADLIATGVDGVIIGRALYDGRVGLSAAIALAGGHESEKRS